MPMRLRQELNDVLARMRQLGQRATLEQVLCVDNSGDFDYQWCAD